MERDLAERRGEPADGRKYNLAVETFGHHQDVVVAETHAAEHARRGETVPRKDGRRAQQFELVAREFDEVVGDPQQQFAYGGRVVHHVEQEPAGVHHLARRIERRLRVGQADWEPAACALEEIVRHLESAPPDRRIPHRPGGRVQGLPRAREQRPDHRCLPLLPGVLRPPGGGDGPDAVPGLQEVRAVVQVGQAGLQPAELKPQGQRHVAAQVGEDLRDPHPAVDQDPLARIAEGAAAVELPLLTSQERFVVEASGSTGSTGDACTSRFEMSNARPSVISCWNRGTSRSRPRPRQLRGPRKPG
jgi:hypothetical protein